MWSYPNLIPLPAAEVERIAARLGAVAVRPDPRCVVEPSRAARRQRGRATLGRSLRGARHFAAPDARRRLPESRVGERVERLVELAQLPRDEREALLPARRRFMRSSSSAIAVEPLEERVELSVAGPLFSTAPILRRAQRRARRGSDDERRPSTSAPARGLPRRSRAASSRRETPNVRGRRARAPGRVGEGAEPDAGAPQRRSAALASGSRPEVDGRMVLGETLEERPPVAGAACVELGGRRARSSGSS